MYDVGRIRKASLAIYNLRPGAGSVLVLLGAAESAMSGLKERREDLSALVAYEGAQQWDKDAARYLRWIEESKVVAEKVAEPGPTTPMWADKYAKLLPQVFTGGLRAGAVIWASLSNQMDALEGAERDLSEQTSWLIKWWVVPVANLAAIYEVPETAAAYERWVDEAKKKAGDFVESGPGLLTMLAIGAALWFGGPLIAAVLIGGRGRDD